MGLHIVGSYQTINRFKSSKYFKTNLGLVATVEKNGNRVYNQKDGFSLFYNNQYKTIIYAQGNIGDMRFYSDHYILDGSFAVYSGDNYEEFLFSMDKDSDLLVKKGIDFYLGHLLKKVEEEYEERVKNEELRKMEPIKEGNSDMLTMNPGNVTYADLKAYLDKKQKDRYKN